MLERQWKATADQEILSGRDVGREFISLGDITGFLRRYFLSITACLVMGALGAAFYIATTDPTYTARTQILIEPKISQLMQQQVAAEVNLSLDTAQVESQIAVIQSDKIALMVIKELKLVDDPAFNKAQSPSFFQRLRRLEALAVSALSLQDVYWYRWLMDLVGWHVTMEAEDQGDELPEFEGLQRTIAIFRDGLDIRRVGVSYAIDISFSSRSSQIAADVANATANAYVREQIENKAAAAREGGRWLESRIKELRTQMNTATEIAQEFRAKHDYGIGRKLDVAPAGGKAATEGESSQDGVGGSTLEELEVTADTYRKIYESFLAAFTNSVSRQSYPVADARVITPAYRPLVPSQPRSKLVMVFGALGGSIFGIGSALLRSMQDKTFRSGRQIRESLGLECIGELPPSRKRGFGRLDEVARSPRSKFTDSLRSAMTAISLAHVAQPIRTIGVTSALPSEGKSACASNLAALYKMAGLRTLVIDSDVSHSALSTGLLSAASLSVVDVDRNQKPIGKLIRPAGTLDVDVLSSHDVDACNLLAPKHMRALLADLQCYDVIIVDLPPLTSGSEKLAISSVLDGVVMVVEWGRTPIDFVIELSRALQANKAPIVGVLMTKARVVSTKRYTRYNTWPAF